MISFVILTFNSQKYLREVLASAAWADEIIIVDSGSSDETETIASEFERVRFIRQDWLGFGAQKQFGVDAAKNDWVFVLDSDEVLTPELSAEIREVVNSNLNAENSVREAGQLREARGFGAVSPERKDGLGSSAQSNLNPVAYKVARLNYFFGAPIKRMGLYPDYTVRLFNRKFARFDGRAVHESVVASGEIGALKNHFIHHAYESVEQFIAKQNRYSNLNARPNKIKAIFHPFWAFFRLYVLKGGFLEGWRGYVIARLYAQYTFWKYVKTRAE